MTAAPLQLHAMAACHYRKTSMSNRPYASVVYTVCMAFLCTDEKHHLQDAWTHMGMHMYGDMALTGSWALARPWMQGYPSRYSQHPSAFFEEALSSLKRGASAASSVDSVSQQDTTEQNTCFAVHMLFTLVPICSQMAGRPMQNLHQITFLRQSGCSINHSWSVGQ